MGLLYDPVGSKFTKQTNMVDKLKNIADLVTPDQIHAFVKQYEEQRLLRSSNKTKRRPGEHIEAIEAVIRDVMLPAFGSDIRALGTPWEDEGTESNERFREIFLGYDPRTRGMLVRSAGAIARGLAHQVWKEQRQVRNEAFKQSLKDRAVPGDVELTDPRRGTAGISGWGSTWMNPDMNPRGPSEQNYNLNDE